MEKTITLTENEARAAFTVMFALCEKDILSVDEWKVLAKLADMINARNDIQTIIKEEMAIAIDAEAAADAAL